MLFSLNILLWVLSSSLSSVLSGSKKNSQILILRPNSLRSCFTWKQSILGGFGAYFNPFDRTLGSCWESSTSDRFTTVLGLGFVWVVSVGLL